MGRSWISRQRGKVVSRYDYNRTWLADMHSPFHCVSFYVPRSALGLLADELGGQRVQTLHVPPGASIMDPTVRGLVNALMPAFEGTAEASRLYLDHVALALSIHLAVNYGEAKAINRAKPGSLLPWQIKMSTEMIDSHIDGELPLTDIARACALSPAYFARAFKASVGMPPYRWMLYRRVEKAKHLMRSTKLSLADIGLICGFQDQVHFSRIFKRVVGVSATEWRADW